MDALKSENRKKKLQRVCDQKSTPDVDKTLPSYVVGSQWNVLSPVKSTSRPELPLLCISVLRLTIYFEVEWPSHYNVRNQFQYSFRFLGTPTTPTKLLSKNLLDNLSNR